MAALASLALRATDTVKIDVIKNPFVGSRNVPELSTNPDYINAAGLERLIEFWGGDLIRPVQDVSVNPEQERNYGGQRASSNHYPCAISCGEAFAILTRSRLAAAENMKSAKYQAMVSQSQMDQTANR